VLSLPPPSHQKFLNLEKDREIEVIQSLVRAMGSPAMQVVGCDCSRESFALLRFGPHAGAPAQGMPPVPVHAN
jgi:hypothetical protein